MIRVSNLVTMPTAGLDVTKVVFLINDCISHFLAECRVEQHLKTVAAHPFVVWSDATQKRTGAGRQQQTKYYGVLLACECGEHAEQSSTPLLDWRYVDVLLISKTKFLNRCELWQSETSRWDKNRGFMWWSSRLASATHMFSVWVFFTRPEFGLDLAPDLLATLLQNWASHLLLKHKPLDVLPHAQELKKNAVAVGFLRCSRIGMFNLGLLQHSFQRNCLQIYLLILFAHRF